jgi:hypothetical protein
MRPSNPVIMLDGADLSLEVIENRHFGDRKPTLTTFGFAPMISPKSDRRHQSTSYKGVGKQ